MLASQNSAVGVARNVMHSFQAGADMARENALLPLKKELLRGQLQGQALEIQTGMLQQQDVLTNKRAFAHLAAAAAEISANAAWANPASEKKIWEIAAAHPSVTQTPQFQNIVKQFDTAGAAAIRAREAETRAASVQNQFELGQQRIEVASEKNALLEDKYKAELSSREKIEAERNQMRDTMSKRENETKLELGRLRLLNEAADFLPKALYRKFSEEVRSIFDDESLSQTAQARKAQDAYERYKAQVKAEEAEVGKPAAAAPVGTNEVIRILEGGRKAIFDSQTKKFLRYGN